MTVGARVGWGGGGGCWVGRSYCKRQRGGDWERHGGK